MQARTLVILACGAARSTTSRCTSDARFEVVKSESFLITYEESGTHGPERPRRSA